MNYFGNGWTCTRGFRRSAERCIKVHVPENAELNYLGNDWTCSRGFRRAGSSCALVQVPDNAELSYLGNDWTCKRGFRKMGTKCDAVQIPPNAEVDYLGNNWKCKRGFRRTGSTCVELRLPEHAELDLSGNDWICSIGFRKATTTCIAMSEQERRAQERAVAEYVARARSASSAACEINGKPAKGDRAEITIKRSGCRGYFVADGPNGHYLLEWYGGYDPDEGDVVIGPINSYGFVDVCYPGHGEGRLYVDNYLLGASRAKEKLADKCR